MGRTFIQDGEVITLTAPGGGVVSGNAYLVGGLLVVAEFDAAATKPFEGKTEGVFNLPKTNAQLWTEGQKLYWDNGNARLDSDPTVGPHVGVAAAGAPNPSATGKIRLNGSSSSLLEGGAEAAVPDLVDNSTGAAADGTIGAVTNPNLAAWDGAHDPTAGEATAINAAITALKDAVKELSTKQNALLASLRLNGIIAP